MRKLCGKWMYVRAVDGLIKYWEVECGLYQWQDLVNGEMNQHDTYKAEDLKKNCWATISFSGRDCVSYSYLLVIILWTVVERMYRIIIVLSILIVCHILFLLWLSMHW